MKEAARLDPDPDAHWHLGKLYRTLGDKEAAKLEFDKASTIHKAANDLLKEQIQAAGSARHATQQLRPEVEVLSQFQPVQKPTKRVAAAFLPGRRSLSVASLLAFSFGKGSRWLRAGAFQRPPAAPNHHRARDYSLPDAAPQVPAAGHAPADGQSLSLRSGLRFRGWRRGTLRGIIIYVPSGAFETQPRAVSGRSSNPSHCGHFSSGSALKFWIFSNLCPHWVQR